MEILGIAIGISCVIFLILYFTARHYCCQKCYSLRTFNWLNITKESDEKGRRLLQGNFIQYCFSCGSFIYSDNPGINKLVDSWNIKFLIAEWHQINRLNRLRDEK